MIPCTVVYVGPNGEDVQVETMTPGLPALGTRFEFHDSDRGLSLGGYVTLVTCVERDGEFTVTVTVTDTDGE